jgi:signal transduction histidine kinase
MIGHDLRNPLTGIKNAAYYLKKKGSACTDDNRRQMLEIIEKSIESANRIINDLLDYSKEMHLELAECSPKSLLESALSIIQIPQGIRIVDHTSNEPTIRADAGKVERVFINLIKNAVDAMPEGGTLEIRSTQTNGNVEIAFADTGTGMSKNIMAKLFTPLFTTKAQGMGFGLPVCKRVIEAHGGKITVESVPGNGATFTVTLPIEPKLKDGGENEWVIPQESLLSTTTKA